MPDLARYVHELHPRTKAVLEGTAAPPPKVKDQLPTGSTLARFNAAVAVRITDGVGTMWCAYVFAAVALVSLPAAISSHSVIVIVAWVAQTFLQLVLLSIIIVGQNVQAAASDKRAEGTYKDAEAVLHEAIEIQRHLAAQDAVLSALTAQATRAAPPQT